MKRFRVLSPLKSWTLVGVTPSPAMECSVCYESGACVKLCCSHEFCSGCIKSWYLKGTGTGCPMCRRPMYWRGFHKTKREWDKEAYETKASETFSQNIEEHLTDSFVGINEVVEEIQNSESIDDARWAALDSIEYVCEDMQTMVDAMDVVDELDTKADIIQYYTQWVYGELMRDLRKMESTLRYLKSEGIDIDTIDDALYYLDHFSDRNIDKWIWYDDPIKERATKYPGRDGGTRTGKRNRAREDPWSEMSFYIII